MSLRLIISVIAGGMFGEGVRHLTRRLIQSRTPDPPNQISLLYSSWSPIVWILAGAFGCGVVAFLISDLVISIEYMGIFLVLISLAVVDNSIRKIPNELLLVLLALKLGAAIVSGDLMSLLPALAGLAAGFILFLIPSYIGLGIGWGDVKLASVAGFCLGIIGILQAAFIMAVVLAFYSLYLVITKKGNLKTKVAIGPSLSLGMMATLLFPLAFII